jgi:hypothetical protein
VTEKLGVGTGFPGGGQPRASPAGGYFERRATSARRGVGEPLRHQITIRWSTDRSAAA